MSFRFGKYNCSRPACQIAADQNGDVALSMTLLPGQHGNEDSSQAEHVTFAGKIKIEGKVVTMKWKDCTVQKGNNNNALITTAGNNSMLSQVVGIIIGSPEFQRK